MHFTCRVSFRVVLSFTQVTVSSEMLPTSQTEWDVWEQCQKHPSVRQGSVVSVCRSGQASQETSAVAGGAGFVRHVDPGTTRSEDAAYTQGRVLGA